MRRAVGVGDAKLGLLLLGISLGALPAMLVTGRIADRAGARLVPVTIGAFAVTGALPPLARSPALLLVLLLMLGAATGAFDVAINTRANALEAASGMRVMDGLHAAFSAGVVLGGIGGGVARRAGAHPTAILIVVCVFLLAVAAANVGAERLPPLPSRPAPLAAQLIVVGAVLAIALLVESGVETWSALFLENGLRTSPAISGLGPGLFAAAMVAGRLSAQRSAPSAAPIRMTLAGLAAAAGLAVTASAHTPIVALGGIVVAGLGLSLSAPTLFRLAGRVGGATAISTVAVVGYLGFVAGPPLFGAVAGASSVRGGFVFLCVTAALLVTTVPILRRVREESHG